MRAIVQREIGGPEVLRLEEVEDPVAGAGQVVVRLRAAALNRRDTYIRTGRYAGITAADHPRLRRRGHRSRGRRAA